MKRLRHPIRSAREPFGKAGLIVAIVALIAAIGGTAFAAAKLNSTQKKEVEKIAKKYAGAPGANGTNGANGSNGANGAPGEKGPKGDTGASGKSVEIGTATAGECSSFGGSGQTVQVAGEPSTKKAVCNGKNGTSGFTETLPSEKTETGAWAFGPLTAEGRYILPVASFAIPLAAPLEGEEHVHYINPNNEEVVVNEEFEEETRSSTACHGTAAAPTAEPGNFCLYATSMRKAGGGSVTLGFNSTSVLNPGSLESSATGTTGAALFVTVNSHTELEGLTGVGTWAVTAE